MNSASADQLHRDLNAALSANIPLSGESNRRIVAKDLEPLEKVTVKSLADTRGDIVELQAQLEATKSIPDWYAAALILYFRTGSSVAVLEGLSIRRFALSKLGRALRWTYFYLAMISLAALLGIGLFYFNSAPRIESLHEDIIRSSAADVPEWIGLDWLPVLSAISVVTTLLFLYLGLTSGNNIVTRWLGGQSYVHNAAAATTFRIAQVLRETGVPPVESVELGLQLTGMNDSERTKLKSLVQDEDSSSDISATANYFDMSAQRRFWFIKNSSPVLLVTLVGGGIAVIYCIAVFSPIFWLFQQVRVGG